MFVELISFVILVYFFVKMYRIGKGDKNRPPGPFQWPIVGNLIDILRADPTYPDVALTNLANKYGDVMSLKFGVHDAVVLSSCEAFKDLLNRNEFTDRYQGFGMIPDRSFHSPNSYGVIWQNGHKWSQLRKYTLRTLRDFGLKRMSTEALIEIELIEFVTEFRSILNSTTENIRNVMTINPEVFQLSFISILWSSVSGVKLSYTDKKLQRICKLNRAVTGALSYNNIAITYPFLRHWFPEITEYNKQMKAFTGIQEYMWDLVQDIKSKYMQRGGPTKAEPHCYIEHFLQMMELEKDKEDTPFTKNQLIMVLADLFLAGTETTSHNFCFLILYLVLYPEVQKKVQDELDFILGNENRPLTYGEINKVPYVEATILETLRLAKAAAFPPARTANVDYAYKGYVIKKGTCILVNTGSVLHSRSCWGDPENFRPERFLDIETQSYVIPSLRDKVVVFGFGKRVCLGETTAKEQIIAYLSTLLRNFTLKVPDGNPKPSMRSAPHTIMKPDDFQVEFIPRNQEIFG